MNMLTTKLAAAGFLFLGTVLSGIWVSHLGKPYNTLIFTIHKLIAVATVIPLAVRIYNLYITVDLQTLAALTASAACGLFFLALIISGALLSLNIPLQGATLRIHQVGPLLALVSATISNYLFAGGNP